MWILSYFYAIRSYLIRYRQKLVIYASCEKLNQRLEIPFIYVEIRECNPVEGNVSKGYVNWDVVLSGGFHKVIKRLDFWVFLL